MRGAAPVANRVGCDRGPVEPQRARARIDEADDGIDGGALARPVGPEIAEDLAAPDVEVHAVEREEAAVSFRQPAGFEHGRQFPLTTSQLPNGWTALVVGSW